MNVFTSISLVSVKIRLKVCNNKQGRFPILEWSIKPCFNLDTEGFIQSVILTGCPYKAAWIVPLETRKTARILKQGVRVNRLSVYRISIFWFDRSNDFEKDD